MVTVLACRPENDRRSVEQCLFDKLLDFPSETLALAEQDNDELGLPHPLHHLAAPGISRELLTGASGGETAANRPLGCYYWAIPPELVRDDLLERHPTPLISSHAPIFVTKGAQV
jgi:hypothetical protein